MITTGENVKFNLFEILSTNNSINSNKEKALLCGLKWKNLIMKIV